MDKAMVRRAMAGRRRQAGFSLVEVLVTLAVITLISMLVIGALSPWLGLKQTIDNDRRLEDVRQGILALYDERAMEVEKGPGGTFLDFVTSVVDENGQCEPQLAAFRDLRTLISDSGAAAAKDGFSNPWCVFISNVLEQDRDGVTLVYRNIAIVSPGRDGKLHEETVMDAQGNMTYGGDDVGFLVSGYDVQYAKLKETLRRMSRVANIYETYFSARYMSYADRDITRYYFSRGPNGEAAYDNDTYSVESTNGQWAPASVLLANIGVSPDDAFTAWEPGDDDMSNAIQVGNYNEQQNGQRVRSPGSTGTGILPYTALLRARIPDASGAERYVTRVVVGNY